MDWLYRETRNHLEAAIKIKLTFHTASQTFGTYFDIWKGKFSHMIDVGEFLVDQSAFGVEPLSAARSELRTFSSA